MPFNYFTASYWHLPPLSCQKFCFLSLFTMPKAVLEGKTPHKDGPEISLKLCANIVAHLCWAANGPSSWYSCAIANANGCLRHAVRKIWLRLLAGKPASSIAKTKKVGNKSSQIYDPDNLVAKIIQLPINFRRTLHNITVNVEFSPISSLFLIKTKKL